MATTTITINKELKERFEELSRLLYGAKLSATDFTEGGISSKIEEMEKELQAKKAKK